jgi:hypothetical protein
MASPGRLALVRRSLTPAALLALLPYCAAAAALFFASPRLALLFARGRGRWWR